VCPFALSFFRSQTPFLFYCCMPHRRLGEPFFFRPASRPTIYSPERVFYEDKGEPLHDVSFESTVMLPIFSDLS